MSTALLYRSNQHWQIWAAFTAAALVHVAAVALAERRDPVPVAGTDAPPVDVFVIDDAMQPPAPPDDAVLDMPPLETVASEFVEDERPTPPPVRRRVERAPLPIARQAQPEPRTQSMSSAKVLAVSAPRPEYPYEARRQRATGSGVALLTIDPASGSVIDARMSRSTGNAALDNATVSAFRRWRFKPGTVTTVQAPITFTLTGAAY